MKTRILTTALMITFATGVFAETNNNKSGDSLYTSNLAVVSGSNASETTDFITASALLPSDVTVMNSVNLEEWVESREMWEQQDSEVSGTDNMQAVNLAGWFESRENWEQENSEVISGATMEAVNLESWINSRESWEQETSASDQGSLMNSASLLENWVSECENWEQEVSAEDLAGQFKGTFMKEWISHRETWEQK